MPKNEYFRPSVSDEETLAYLLHVERRLVTPDVGLWVLFEFRDFELGEFKNDAFYTDRGTKEPNTPAEIKVYLDKPTWSHFIWIPKDIVAGCPQRLVFRYAHECQHYRQLYDPNISQHNEDFRDWMLNAHRWHKVDPNYKNNLDEFDADREARDTFIDIFGPRDWHLFVERESANKSEKERFFRLDEIQKYWYSAR